MKNQNVMTQHEINLPKLKPFKIWNDNGKVMQSGWMLHPAQLADFGNTTQGKIEAGAFISGMLTLAKMQQ